MVIKIDFLLSVKIYYLAHARLNLLHYYWLIAGDKYYERPPVNRFFINFPHAIIYL